MNIPPDGHLQRKYPDAFMRVWDGCSHQDCLPECRADTQHCERLKRAFEAWSMPAKGPAS